MSERYKVFDNDKPYFVTLSLVHWIKLFKLSEYADIVVESIIYCQQNKTLEVYAYCIMPSHVHLIVRSQQENLSSVIRDLKKYTSNMICKKLYYNHEKEILDIFAKAASKIKRNWHYKVWQDGFHPIEITSNKFFDQKLNYIHNNPVEDGLVLKPDDYIYSSARNYAEKKSKIEIIVESI